MSLLRQDVPLPEAWPPPSDRNSVSHVLGIIQRRDPIGHRVHTVLAALFLFTLPLVTAGSAITFGLLLIYALIRLPNTWRCYSSLLRVPVLWALAAWIAITAVSLTWSDNVSLGADELSAARVLLLPLLVWPVMSHLQVLLGAALLGVLAQNILQAGELIGIVPHDPDDAENRIAGLLHPIHTGAWTAAAMCWLLAIVMYARDRWRWLALVLAIAAAAGAFLAGSRGPWLAAGAAVPLVILTALVRRHKASRPAIALAVSGVVGLAVAWPIVNETVEQRFNAAMTHYHDAVDQQTYDTSVGSRIAMWTWAWTMFADSPVGGVGAGAYHHTAREQPTYQAAIERDPNAEVWFKDHAHSTYLHTLATTGAVGGAALLAAIVFLLMQAGPMRISEPWSHGTLFVVIGWLIGAQFDCYHLNSHLFGLFALAVTASIAIRPNVEPVAFRLSMPRSVNSDPTAQEPAKT